jgi:alginate O-acetyltransferase complex protein AlgI
MVFSSAVFLFLFLPIVLALYFVVPQRAKNLLLLIASLFFYAWGEGLFVAIMLISILTNYGAGVLIDRFRDRPKIKVVLILAIVANLSLLGIYKYANFLVDNLNDLLALIHITPIYLEPIHLPIGISFFTFQAISYIVDVFRGEAAAQKNPINIALYIAMFPQLIAGPIVRYHDVAQQIRNRTVNLTSFSYGISRFIIGLGKKMLIANPMGHVADQVFALPTDELTFSLTWLGVICYSLQIYFDFSAYSDMAIGLGRMFGFRFLENFNYPYISDSIQAFWRRWHISLSSWFRDYLYIPLGGNRRAAIQVYLNLVMIFFLCGLWHGASWNFVIWGLIHGAFLVLERLGFRKQLDNLWLPLRHIYVLTIVMLAWVFFRAEDLTTAISYLEAMFGFGHGSGVQYHVSLYIDLEGWLVLFIGIIGSLPIIPYLKKFWEHELTKLKETPGWFERALKSGVYCANLLALSGILIVSSMYLAAETHNPFIYFRF